MIPAAEQIALPSGQRGETFPAAVATSYFAMFLEAPNGGRFIGLALSPQPLEAVVAKLTAPQARQLALDLMKRANALEERSPIIMPVKH